jgi:ATP-dependent Clp protease ATP-binding subunit ClpA
LHSSASFDLDNGQVIYKEQLQRPASDSCWHGKMHDAHRQQDHVIVVQMIDEVHTLIGAGAAEGAIDAANILKPALARGELQCMGATTLDEYRKHIEKDPALERRFQPVRVNEPTVDETYQILQGAQGPHRFCPSVCLLVQ